MNTMNDEHMHAYENLTNSMVADSSSRAQHNYENYANLGSSSNPYEDDVVTVYSEGVRSEYNDHAPPLPDRPPAGHGGADSLDDEEVILGLGELSEADERVQRYYGILPKVGIEFHPEKSRFLCV